MIKLFDVDEHNFFDIISLKVSKEQQKFLSSPTNILARGYIYRSYNTKIFGISRNEQVIGIALVKDMNEQPVCYDLQQFMIDEKYQNKGYGTIALRQILLLLSKEGKYENVEVCVNKDNIPALKMFGAAGFTDTGYMDKDAPDCVNLICKISGDEERYTDIIINDFSEPSFQNAFKKYFAELEYVIVDWDVFFKEMNKEPDNSAFVRTDDLGKTIGFILFKTIKFTSWFFEENCGFIREFWIDEKYRNKSHGSKLLKLVEKYFMKNGIYTCILTTDTAERFYKTHGYIRAHGCISKNGDDVFIKHLS